MTGSYRDSLGLSLVLWTTMNGVVGPGSNHTWYDISPVRIVHTSRDHVQIFRRYNFPNDPQVVVGVIATHHCIPIPKSEWTIPYSFPDSVHRVRM